jgi:hypothetical protein
MTARPQTPLPTLDCPLCKHRMTNDSPRVGRRMPARSFGACLRRCPACKVGFSNTPTAPTLIHEDPTGNVPAQVRKDILLILDRAINKLNRQNKIRKFGYSTSEDAVSWTVFSFLCLQRPDVTSRLARTLFNLQPSEDASVLLWGVPITPGHGQLHEHRTHTIQHGASGCT